MNAYLFDVDGVITDPMERKITKPDLTTQLITLLQNGNVIGLISGRGLIWLRSRVIKILEKYLDDHPVLDRTKLDAMYISGEFGGVTAIYEKGERKEFVNKELSLPQEIRKALEARAEIYSEYVFVDIEKQTQFTAEANFAKSVNLMDNHGEEIAAGLKEVIQNQPDLEIQIDRLAVNVRNKKANKLYATQQFLNRLAEKKFSPEKYFVFGDSPSDLEIGHALQEKKLPFTFVFTGEQDELPKEQVAFPVTVTKEHFDTGTLEYLKNTALK